MKICEKIDLIETSFERVRSIRVNLVSPDNNLKITGIKVLLSWPVAAPYTLTQ